MLGEWISTTIGEHVELITGEAFKSARFGTIPESGILLARGDNVKEGEFEWGDKARYWPELTPDLIRYLLCEGDILIGMDGSKVGKNWVKVRKKDLPCLLVQRVACLRAKETMDQGFLRFLIGNQRFRDYIEQVKTGTSIPHISGTQIKSYNIKLPTLPEQRAIGYVLGKVDDKIELNRRMNATMEEMTQTLFRSWFVDFDPIKAKAEGREPEEMDAEIAALFPDAFEESAIGVIPEGWRVGPVTDVCEVNGWTLTAKDDLQTINYIEISETNRGDIGSIPVYKRGEEPSRARRRLRHGDTVLSTVRPDRRAYFLAYTPPPDLIASTGFAVITPKSIPWGMIHAALTSSDVFEHLGRIADGGAYPAVNPSAIGELSILLPGKAIAQAFADIVEPLYSQMAVNRSESRMLSAVRDELLPKLVSGEVRLSPDMLQEFQVESGSAPHHF